jgi:PAS domain S-box-containing protein
MAVLVDNARLYRDLDKAYRELELIYNRVSDLIFLVRVERGHVYRCISANRACIESLGLSEVDVVGKRIEEFLPPPLLAIEKAKFAEAVEAGSPVQYELSSDLPDGPMTFETTVVPIPDRAGNCAHLLGVARNVSERKRSEREIIRLERLHALEEMARGVSHNFNNILVGVLGYAQLIEMHSKDRQTVDNAREIVDSALRAKELVQRLNLAVGKKADSPPDLVDNLDAIVQDAIEATRPRWKDEAEAHGLTFEVISTPADVPPVGATSEGLQRILVHLISNAIDAMPGGGRIELSTTRTGKDVELRVRDGGIGMDDDTRLRIFDPFFTTKQDVGSGLGLSMVYRTVTSWGGRIDVESAPGRGTTFIIGLPVWQQQGEPEEGIEVPVETRGGRILVIDDEEAVLDILGQALGEHTLVALPSGEGLLDDFQPDQYDLALIDLGMPGPPGDEIARGMREVDPHLVTVLISGWDLSRDDPRLSEFDFYLKKPFKLNEAQDVVDRGLALRERKLKGGDDWRPRG